MPSGANWANVFCVWNGSAGHTATVAELATVIGNFHTAWSTNIKPLIATDVTMTLIKALYYNPDGSVITNEVTYTDVGTGAGTTITDATSSCLSWGILTTWRGGKPRTYLPGVWAAELLNPAHLTTTRITARQAGGTAFLAAVNAITWPVTLTNLALGTVSFYSGNAPRVPAKFFNYQSCFVHSRIDTMRRRLGKET
jgi:hypothetical protein